jgi:hypothetical protein
MSAAASFQNFLNCRSWPVSEIADRPVGLKLIVRSLHHTDPV